MRRRPGTFDTVRVAGMAGLDSVGFAYGYSN